MQRILENILLSYDCKGQNEAHLLQKPVFYRELVPYRCDQKEEMVGWEVREKMASW